MVGFQDAPRPNSIMNRQPSSRHPAGLLDRLPAAAPGRTARMLWAGALGALVIGIGGWALGSVATGVIGLWALMVAAAALGLVLPLPLALVSPLFMGVLGWLVDMLPLVILTGWSAVVVRWAVGVLRERRLPRGRGWVWLLGGLAAWTALGVLVIQPGDLRHFTLLVGIQGVISGVVLAVIDQLRTVEQRAQVVSGLSVFIVFLSVAVSFVVGYVMLIILTLHIPGGLGGIPATIDPANSPAVLYIVYANFDNVLFGHIIAIIIGVAMWLCGLSSITSMSRMWFAFARDDGMPASSLIKQIHPKWRTPVWSIIITCILAVLLTIYSAVYSVIVAVSTTALYLAYAIPIYLNIRNKARKQGEYATPETAPPACTPPPAK